MIDISWQRLILTPPIKAYQKKWFLLANPDKMSKNEKNQYQSVKMEKSQIREEEIRNC
jgi:hypothetical protein